MPEDNGSEEDPIMLLALATPFPSLVGAAVSISRAERCLAAGVPCNPAPPATRASLPELLPNTVLLWENGPANGVSGWPSDRAATFPGTGGPTGNHGATTADDFQVPPGIGQLTFAACLTTTANIVSAEMWVWADSGGSPQLPVTNPLLGNPSTANISSTTFLRNTTYCPDLPDFELEGRLYLFSQATTGVSLTLSAGTYWFSAIGVGPGGANQEFAFFETSSPATPLAQARFGSTAYSVPYWTPVGSLTPDPLFHNVAFRVVGEVSAQAIPTLSRWGLVLLGLALAAAAAWAVKLRR